MPGWHWLRHSSATAGDLTVWYVMDPSMTMPHRSIPGLQDLQKRAWKIVAKKNAEKADENTWIGRMLVAESLGDLEGLIKSHAA